MRIRIRDPESFWPWIPDGKIRIRDKHPGSATLLPRFRNVISLKKIQAYLSSMHLYLKQSSLPTFSNITHQRLRTTRSSYIHTKSCFSTVTRLSLHETHKIAIKNASVFLFPVAQHARYFRLLDFLVSGSGGAPACVSAAPNRHFHFKYCFLLRFKEV